MNNKLYVAGWACDMDDHGYIWMSHFGINGFFKYNIQKDMLEYAGRFEGVPSDKELIHSELFCLNDKVFFNTIIDGKGYVYDISLEKMMIIRMPSKPGVQMEMIFKCDKDAYARLSDNSIYRIDRSTLELTYCDDISNVVNDYSKMLDVNPIGGSAYSEGHYGIYQYKGNMCCIYRNHLRIINLQNGEYRDVVLPDNKVFQLFFNNDELWYTHHYDTNIICYDILSGDHITYDGHLVEYREGISENARVRPYSYLCFSDDDVIIPGYRAKGFYKIDKANRIVDKWTAIEDSTELNEWNGNDLHPHYLNMFRYMDELICVPNSNKKLIKYNIKTGDVIYRDFSIAFDKIPDFLIETYKGGIANERVYSLDSFIEAVKRM